MPESWLLSLDFTSLLHTLLGYNDHPRISAATVTAAVQKLPVSNRESDSQRVME